MRTLIAIVTLTLAASVSAGEVSFAAKPTATKAGDATKIAFTLAAPADVEIAVLDAKDKVVRHLAAGALGAAKAPPPPLKEGLAQELAWDGKDDFGKAAEGGPFKVRVRAGMGVKFGKIFGTNPYTGSVSSGGPTDSIATDAEGTLYVKMGSFVPQLHAGTPWQLRKFDKTGKYVKTLLPYAASTDPAKTPGFKLLETGDGFLAPAHQTPLDVVLYNFGENIHNRVVDGQVVYVDNGAATLRLFKLDGSNELKVVKMRSAPDKLKWPNWLAPQVAFSPDGKYAYYSNVANTPYDGKKPEDIDANFPQGRIYRQDLSGESDPAPFYDLVLPDFAQTKYWMPSAWDKKTAAAGIDTDGKGNLFVCDLVNQEVVEVSPDGKKLSATKVPWPDKVLVNRKTGTLYVVSCAVSRGFRPPAKLLKISGRGADAKVAAELALPGNLGQALALDETADPPALWLAGGAELRRVEDKGAELALTGANLLNPDPTALSFVCFGDVDVEAELVYITEGMGRVWRYNGKTGEGELMPFKACDVAIGPTGTIYGWGDTGSYQGPVARYGRDGKPLPLADGKHTYGSVFGRYGRGNNAPGMDVDWQGRVYAACGFNNCHIRVYDGEGKLVDYPRNAQYGEKEGQEGVPSFLAYVLDQGGSIRIDPAGNVYVMEIGLPKGFVPPKGYEKDSAFQACSATIWKFTPKGGTFKKGKDGWEGEGAVQTYAPTGPVSGSWNSTMSVCHCTRPRFDVDAYGRLYIPNGITFKVALRDNVDNSILDFGAYGNYDAQGPESSEPKPAIPLGWPIFAGATDEHVYVGDGLNHRVVRVDKTFAAAETCDVK